MGRSSSATWAAWRSKWSGATRAGAWWPRPEWHPYGEVLWVYGTEHDGDTIYVGLLDVTAGVFYGPYAAPGTDAVVEYRRVNLNLTDGHAVRLYFYDGADGTDFLGTSGLGRA